MKWTTLGVEPEYNEETGEYSEGEAGVVVEIPCRFYPGGTKIFKNQDSMDVMQKGTIRFSVGEPMPRKNDEVEVVGLFKGLVQETYSGRTTQRIEV